MPFPNFHACRIREPGEFRKGSIRTVINGGIHILVGKLKGKSKTTTQAYRYPKGTWGAARARKHCKENGGRFEAASGTNRELGRLRSLVRRFRI